MKKTQIIAHRGFWKTNPETSENSIQALKNAQELQVYGSEFDVQMTKDAELIVFHDEWIDDLEIAETNFEDLKDLRLSNAENIPTLEDYLIQGKKASNCKLIVELKPCKTKELEYLMVKKALELIQKYDLENQREFISFSLNICKTIKKEKPNFIVFYLNGDLNPQELKEAGLDGFDYDFELLLANLNWISEAQNLGLKTNSWTVNDSEIFRKLSDAGIDFITTNTPDVFVNE
ncbi:glycerophosphoryl diester phosphodiesterase [Soonwooa buanensis]|uniref:Glycerophosphoryl diester phosphodiesterase n=1 Tax=Soonwooa buanensis TaxID=619805 RepID=A0A1T5D224_9FLAO|nr:glycerophosphodiester phosphodiesterase family protein [Soonwooa buanensis]SKB65742.1 glycerophosphoryl diester phosphodiesterase [Soonwooa buanensis]